VSNSAASAGRLSLRAHGCGGPRRWCGWRRCRRSSAGCGCATGRRRSSRSRPRRSGWHAVSLELVGRDAAAAAPGYERALAEATARGDLLLESYAVRHLGSQAWDAGQSERAIALFERSLDLRAARAARPHTAAAQAALAEVLGTESDRAASLRSAVAATAAELGLGWLK
jgi:hypothetical protein